MARPKPMVPLDVILGKVNLMSGVSDEPVDLAAYEAAAKAILIIVENYLIKALGEGRAELESLGIDVDN